MLAIDAFVIRLLGNVEGDELPEVVEGEADERLRQAVEDPERIDRVVETDDEADGGGEASEEALAEFLGVVGRQAHRATEFANRHDAKGEHDHRGVLRVPLRASSGTKCGVSEPRGRGYLRHRGARCPVQERECVPRGGGVGGGARIRP